MKRTLIELHDVNLLSECKTWLKQHPEKENLFLVKNFQEAMTFMQIHPVDFFLIDLSLSPSEPDGLESLAALSAYDGALKVALLIPVELKSAIDEKFHELNSIYFINRPNTLADFIDTIDVLDFAELLSNPAAEMTVADFFRLLEIQKKTCLLEIEAEGKLKKGKVYFNEGVLYDAIYAESRTELALIEILRWENVKILFKSLDHRVLQKIHKHVQTSLTQLIAKAAEVQPEVKVEVNKPSLESMVDDIIARAEAMIKDEELKAKAKIEAETKRKAETETKEKAEMAEMAKLAKLDLSSALKSLQGTEECLAAGIFDMSGKVLAKHNHSPYDIEGLAENMVALIGGALDAMSGIGLGAGNFIELRCDNGILESVWKPEKQLGAVILLSAEAKNTGLVKRQLTKMCDAICKQLE
jgi:Domain of unknown function (DUF4388)